MNLSCASCFAYHEQLSLSDLTILCFSLMIDGVVTFKILQRVLFLTKLIGRLHHSHHVIANTLRPVVE